MRKEIPDAMRSAPTTTAKPRARRPAIVRLPSSRPVGASSSRNPVRCHNPGMDATVVAVPGYFATMGAEHELLKRRAERDGPSAADYERHDTITSLSMGVASLLAPVAMGKLLAPFTPGRGKYGKALVATAASAIAATVIADRVARRAEREPKEAEYPVTRARRRRFARRARKVASAGAAVVTAGTAITTAWTAFLAPGKM